MTLADYWLKRDFRRTPEPRGKIVNSKKELAFYIQRHHARALHYDFRLELQGALKSWAIPKGPSLDPSDKRLAVRVEDHPLAYGKFEGSIPPHQYGAGEVVLWDKGVWLPLHDPIEGYRNGHLKFELNGDKLSGRWALVRMGKPGPKENWLLIKERDEEAKIGRAARITELRPESVASLKTKKSLTPELDSLVSKRLTSSPLPPKLRPQLATLVKTAPVGKEWISETKFDGYRALSRIKDSKVAIYTRNENDWTEHWPRIAHKLTNLPVDEAWLDGEVVAIKDGKISFGALQNYEHDTAHVKLKYYVFDVVHLNGQDISHLPLVARKSLLKEILSSQEKDSPILYSEHTVGYANRILKAACKEGLEGIVFKRADSPYIQARTQNWLKLKCVQRQEFVVGGYTDSAGSRQGFGALLLGYYNKNNDFIYAGRVGTGFNDKLIHSLSKKFLSLTSPTPPFKDSPKKKGAIGVHWLKPTLVAEVNFAEWTSDGVIRHSSFVGLRTDKAPQAITREIPIETEDIRQPRPSIKKAAKELSSTEDTVAEVKITHPGRVIFTPEHITKLDVAKYYQGIERWILPHLAHRPLSLLRCPDGAEKGCFFQKHLNGTNVKKIQAIEIAGHDTGKYLVVNNLPALIGLVQMGVIEFHTWGSVTRTPHKPNRIIFDLDPDPKLPWEKVIEGAHLVKFLLDSIGLRSFLKTTGGKGLHIVVPIKPDLEFSEVKAFSRAIALHLAKIAPTYFTAMMSKAKRRNKIYLDYLRNGEEATAIAPYSVRARLGAPVSVPIGWEELDENLRSNSFNMQTVQGRLVSLKKDPWEGYFACRQRITAGMSKLFN